VRSPRIAREAVSFSLIALVLAILGRTTSETDVYFFKASRKSQEACRSAIVWTLLFSIQFS
jgi:hypothetical protein